MLRRNLRLVHRRRPQALRALDHGSRFVRGEFILSGAAGRHVDSDVAGPAGAGVVLRRGLHRDLGAGAASLVMPSVHCSTISIGHWLIELYGLGGKVEAFRASYAEWGAWIIIGKGLTPIPYKLVTITSGFAGYNIWLFILCSMIARGGRFFRRRNTAQPLWRHDPSPYREAAGPLGSARRHRPRARLHRCVSNDLARRAFPRRVDGIRSSPCLIESAI